MDKFDLCRLCALKQNNLLSIYGEEGVRLSIEKKIKECLNLELTDLTNLPSSICMKCCSKLEDFDEFLENTKKAQDALKIIFSDCEIRNLNCTSTQEIHGLKSLSGNIDGDYDRENFDIENISSGNVNSNVGCQLVDTCHSESRPLEEDNNIHNRPILIENTSNSRTCNDSISESSGEDRGREWDLQTWLCCDCSEELSTVEELRLHHESEHKQEPKYMCVYCSKLFLLYSAFTAHLKRHKNSIKYNCHECGKGFTNKKVLEAHTLTHSNIRPYSCQDCGKCFRQQSSLYIHSRCHLPDDVKNKFPCELCSKRFSTKPNLVTHMRIHSGIRNFTCDQCGKSFIQKGNLDAHLLTHSHDKPYFCEICNKRFKTGMQLRKHHSVHTGAKPHQCDICGRTFREKGTLREHHRIHTGAMPFTCEFCGKSFRFKGILTTHRRQHTGERPYSCLECQHHFTNWPNYNKHMKRRHGINTSRSTRAGRDGGGGVEDCQSTEPVPSHMFQDISGRTEVYQPQSTLSSYMYNVYSLPQVPIDPLPI